MTVRASDFPRRGPRLHRQFAGPPDERVEPQPLKFAKFSQAGA
jgi:hypothetical protein